MRSNPLPAALLLALSAAGPAPAQTPRWEATATPVRQDDGRVYCLMTGRQGQTEVSVYAAPDLRFLGVNAPALRERATTIEITLGVGTESGNGIWRGEDGNYVKALAPGGVTNLLESILISEAFMGEAARLWLRDGDNDLVQVPLAGASVAGEVMSGCIPQLPDD